MKAIILLLPGLPFNSNLFSQGGVDVKYIPIDSVNKKYVGQSIKIDFTGKAPKEYLIQKARIRDTVKIFVTDKYIDLIEVKGVGVDYWYLRISSYESSLKRNGIKTSKNELILHLKKPEEASSSHWGFTRCDKCSNVATTEIRY